MIQIVSLVVEVLRWFIRLKWVDECSLSSVSKKWAFFCCPIMLNMKSHVYCIQARICFFVSSWLLSLILSRSYLCQYFLIAFMIGTQIPIKQTVVIISFRYNLSTFIQLKNIFFNSINPGESVPFVSKFAFFNKHATCVSACHLYGF